MSLSDASRSTDGHPSARICDSLSGSSGNTNPDQFVDRRRSDSVDRDRPNRRQFGSSHTGLSPEGRELAIAIDQYKVQNHRRYLTCDELLRVLTQLGYGRNEM